MTEYIVIIDAKMLTENQMEYIDDQNRDGEMSDEAYIEMVDDSLEYAESYQFTLEIKAETEEEVSAIMDRYLNSKLYKMSTCRIGGYRLVGKKEDIIANPLANIFYEELTTLNTVNLDIKRLEGTW